MTADNGQQSSEHEQTPAVPLWTLPVYLLLAVWATWPLAGSLFTHLPMGTETTSTVPLFNAWTVWWNAEAATHGCRGYWDAPIFHPTENTFAFSEPQPTTLSVAPAVWFSDTPIPAYNVYLLLSLTLNGWFAARLLTAVHGRLWPAIAGGVMVELLPFVHWQLGVLQLVPLWGVLWTLQALWQFRQQPSVGSGLLAGAGFAVTYLMCNHYGLFFSVLLIASVVWLPGRCLLQWTAWKRLLPGVVLSVLLLAPVVAVQLRVSREHEWQRDPFQVRDLSAEWGDYTAAAWPQLLPLRDFADEARRDLWPLSPGYLKLLLAAVGLAGGLIIRRFRWWTAACATMLVFALVLSQGPKFRIGSVQPYQWFVTWYPGFAAVRNVFRFAVFVQLMVALLAVGGLVVLAMGFERYRNTDNHKATRGRPQDSGDFGPHSFSSGAPESEGEGVLRSTLRAGQRNLSSWTIVLIGCVAALEIRPPRQNLYEVPPVETQRAWIEWMREKTAPEDVIVCVPFVRGSNAAAYQQTTLWMHWGMSHRRPMAGGYSGFFPEPFYELKKAMRNFPDEESLVLLRKRGVRYCVVKRSHWREIELQRWPAAFPQLTPVFTDDTAQVDIFRLK